jgi:hypothetical protein
MKSLGLRRHRAAIVLVLALLSFAIAAEGSQPVHTHEDGRPGIYNAECPLAQLAAVHADGWVPQRLAIGSPAQVALSVAVTSGGWAPSLSASFTDSRAPPLA